ncbi:TonB-dependent receptor [Alloacidobacterium dinghuense]|uniref:TonB-dependent receptor n=1 Tax=Alloacidobacterium dinghuense TaxID=2763107 RepID=A0A7G8BDC9_9BACT|nr:carboxypeptidase regulatory-like domain-containing protein [Alloacidobacterium dinghuense]QNI30549.1 TonB-dependent receptor [Alloacidobacterium dinghuense]
MRKRNLQLAIGIWVMCFFASPWLRAQSESGSITGQVTDSQGSAVAGADVTVTNIGTGASIQERTNGEGTFAFSTLHPSHYKLTVQKDGFKLEVNPDVDLHVQDKLAINFTLTVGSSNETVTVSASSGANLETSAAVTTTVDRQFIENMPLNGRSFQALIALTPGNVTAKTYYTNSGQFSVNGQRTDANYFSIDGVSANVGITQGSNVYLGSAGAGASQATSNNGGYNSLVSVDAMQEYKIQTSSFDPEYGRTPGAQLSIVTRSGTNRFHGTAFEYLRNEVFDANNWFNNNAGLPRAAEKQNDFGGVIGGPIWRDKVFFFFSYEGLRLRVPESRQDIVPSTALRARADAVVGPLLDAYPLPSHALPGYPNNDAPDADTAIFATTFSNPSTLNASSLRLDYTISPKLNVFVRGDYAPSNGAQYGAFDFYTRSTLSHTIANVDTETAGLTFTPTGSLVNDFRFNLSHAKGATVVTPTNFGGATIPTDAYLFQSNPIYTTATSVFSLILNDGSTDYYVGNDATNHQRQLNFIDTVSWVKGRHNMKFGVDYRRLTPKNGYRPWDIGYNFNTFADVLTHVPISASIDTTDTSELRPVFYDLSLYAQDSWQVSPRLTLTYGVRWDYDPPPGEDSGHPFYTALNLNDPPNVALAPLGTPLWNASKHNFAPRLGVAYVIKTTPGRELVFRGAGGIFYGLGNQQGAQGTLGFPYSRSKFLYGTDGTYPVSQANAAPVPFTLDPPYGFVFAFEPNLRDPKVYQWNASLEQALGESRAFQIAYVGNVGSDLLRRDMLQPDMGGNPNFQYLDVVTNQAWSNYNSLQAQFRQRMWQHLQILASYTWAHALDNGSSVALPNPYYTVYNPDLDRGNSDYDVRNSFSAAISYELPGTRGGNAVVKYITNGWAADSLLRTNSAQPINITTGQYSFGLVWNPDAINQRPNVNTGVPLFVSGAECAAANGGANCPGGRRLNPAHFSAPTGLFTQGNLGRNQLRGYDAVQEDLAIRRSFPIHETVSLEFRAEAFNIFNHPMFGDIGTQSDGRNLLNNSLFGISAHTLADSLGSGGADGGFSSLYQIGSPRSLQFALKVKF